MKLDRTKTEAQQNRPGCESTSNFRSPNFMPKWTKQDRHREHKALTAVSGLLFYDTSGKTAERGLFLPALSYILYMLGRTILYELSFKDTQKKNFSKQVLCPIKLPLRPTCINAVPILINLFKSLTKYVEYLTELLYNYIKDRSTSITQFILN